MKLTNRSFVVLSVVLVLIGLFAIAAINNRRSSRTTTALAKQQGSPTEEVIPDGFVRHGGVVRPRHDVVGRQDRTRGPAKTPYHPGLTPVVRVDSNANTKSLGETESDPEQAWRRSALQPAPPFDLAAYQKDPQAYLDEVVVGRIWQPAPPSTETATIRRIGQYRHSLIQGESLRVEVEVEPGMPVHFHSERLGQFPNGLPTITVQADENGRAQTQFHISSGTRDYIDLLASSPVHSGYARWLVEIDHPRGSHRFDSGESND